MIHKEVILNQVLGIITGWLIVYFIFPYLAELSQEMIATVSMCLFFVSSYVRSYLLRVYFESRREDNAPRLCYAQPDELEEILEDLRPDNPRVAKKDNL